MTTKQTIALQHIYQREQISNVELSKIIHENLSNCHKICQELQKRQLVKRRKDGFRTTWVINTHPRAAERILRILNREFGGPNAEN